MTLMSLTSKCLDGTPAGFYVDTYDSDKFVVWLEGGGLCLNSTDCQDRSKGILGSSSQWTQTIDFDAGSEYGLLSRDKKLNPDFHDWNHVFVPYCSGDLYTGTPEGAVDPWGAGDPPLYFHGNRIVQEIFALAATLPVSELVLTGCSAGGIGTIYQCDAAAAAFPKARTSCRPEAGWFGLPLATYDHFTANTTDPDPHHFADSAWTKQLTMVNATDAYKACVNNPSFLPEDECPDPRKCCGEIPWFYSYTETPMLVTENTADSYQVFVQGLCPMKATPAVEAYVEYQRQRLVRSMVTKIVKGAKAKTDGIFAPACLNHAVAWQGGTVQGLSSQQAFGQWYKGESTMLLNDTARLSMQC